MRSHDQVSQPRALAPEGGRGLAGQSSLSNDRMAATAQIGLLISSSGVQPRARPFFSSLSSRPFRLVALFSTLIPPSPPEDQSSFPPIFHSDTSIIDVPPAFASSTSHPRSGVYSRTTGIQRLHQSTAPSSRSWWRWIPWICPSALPWTTSWCGSGTLALVFGRGFG